MDTRTAYQKLLARVASRWDKQSKDLRAATIRLAYANPNLRPALLPLLKTGGQTTVVPIRSCPDGVQKALKALKFTQSTISISGANTYTVQDFGGDGVQGVFATFRIDDGRFVDGPDYGSFGGPNPWTKENRVDTDDNTYPIKPGIAVFKGYRGGMAAGTRGTLKLHPNDYEGFVAMRGPSSQTPLSVQEKAALDTIGGIISGYRRDAFERAHLGIYGPQNPHIRSLVQKDLVKMTGAGIRLTPEGMAVRAENR